MIEGFKHKAESREKMRQAKLGGTLTEEHKRKIGLASKCIGISPETRAKMVVSRKANNNYIFSEEQKRKLSIARKRRIITAETRAKLGRTTKGHKYALGHRHSQDTKNEMSRVRKLWWQNSVYRDKVVRNTCLALNIHPNKPETLVMNLLNEVDPNNWKFVGDGQVVIEGRIPDFFNTNGHKKIIEVFGDYWHGERARCYEETEEGRKALFDKYGYTTLVIWESELKNPEEVRGEIREFCEKGGRIE